MESKATYAGVVVDVAIVLVVGVLAALKVFSPEVALAVLGPLVGAVAANKRKQPPPNDGPPSGPAGSPAGPSKASCALAGSAVAAMCLGLLALGSRVRPA